MLDGIPTRLFLSISAADYDAFYRMELLGTFLGAIAFGIAAILVLSTAQILLGNSCMYPKPMRTSLLCYVAFMFSMAVLACVQQVSFLLRRASFRPDAIVGLQSPQAQLNQTHALPFVIWGADAFLLWRCILLYKGVSGIVKATLLFATFISTSCSLGSGIFFFFSERFISSRLHNLPTIIVVSSSALVNIVLRTLIVARILYHQRFVRKAMGSQYASMYTKIISMCVESCAMTSICGVVFLGLYFSSNRRQVLASVVPLILLPHICVITPLLLVYRVAKGRNVTVLCESGPVASTAMSGTTNQGTADLQMHFKSHTTTLSTGHFSHSPTRCPGDVETPIEKPVQPLFP